VTSGQKYLRRFLGEAGTYVLPLGFGHIAPECLDDPLGQEFGTALDLEGKLPSHPPQELFPRHRTRRFASGEIVEALASGKIVTGNKARPWARRHSTRWMATIGIAAAMVALGSALALAGLQHRGGVSATTRGCEPLRQYRVVTGGNVLSSGGDIIATVGAGDLFDARTTNGTPYHAHRYYGVVLRTGVWATSTARSCTS